MKDKNGFTLIELLAVIVILAIVTVMATQTVLPYMSNARPQAFGIEATNLVTASKKAVELYNLNQVQLKNDGSSCKKENVFCFTVAELIDLGIYDGDSDSYKGKIIVDYTDSKKPKYNIYVQKGAEFSIVNSSETDFVNNTKDILEGGFDDEKFTEYTTCTCK